jgi:hypothetical protein
VTFKSGCFNKHVSSVFLAVSKASAFGNPLPPAEIKGNAID